MWSKGGLLPKSPCGRNVGRFLFYWFKNFFYSYDSLGENIYRHIACWLLFNPLWCIFIYLYKTLLKSNEINNEIYIKIYDHYFFTETLDTVLFIEQYMFYKIYEVYKCTCQIFFSANSFFFVDKDVFFLIFYNWIKD